MRPSHTILIMLTTLAACYDGRADSPFPEHVDPAADSGDSSGADSEGGDASGGDESSDGGEIDDASTSSDSSSGGHETGEDADESTGTSGGLEAMAAVDVCELCGCLQWSSTIASGVVLDATLTTLPDGGALTTTVTNTTLTVQRFAADGAVQWSREFSGSVANAHAVAIGEEFIVIAGTVREGGLMLDPDVVLGSNGGDDGFVALLSDSSDGGISWAGSFGDAADQRVGALAVSCSEGLKDCRIHLAGLHSGELGLGPVNGGGATHLFHTQLDAFVWEPAAAQTWRIATNPDAVDLPTLAKGPDGTITLVGTVRDADPGDIVARRLGPAEQELWSVRLSAPGEQEANAAAHAGDRLWVAGYVVGMTDLGAGPFGVGDEGTAFFAGIDPGGEVVASRAISGRLPGSQGLATTAAGDVVVAGFTNADIDLGGGLLDFAGGLDVMLARFDEAGEYMCGALYGDGKVQEGVAAASAGERTFVLARVEGSIDFGDGVQASESGSLVLAAFAE